MSSRQRRAAIAADTSKHALQMYVNDDEIRSTRVIGTKNFELERYPKDGDDDEKDGRTVWDRVRPTVLNCHCVDLAMRLHEETGGDNDAKKVRVAVMNLASYKRPGGGFLSGAKAYEEDLCRRSTLYKQLDSVAFTEYPLHDKVLFHRAVDVFKDKYYEMMDHPVRISVASVAGIPPKEIRNNRLTSAQLKRLERRIEASLEQCYLFGIKAVVLGALGCGVYKHPPDQVAGCFRRVLSKRVFVPRVYFAILEQNDDGDKEETSLGPLGHVFEATFA